MRSKQQINNRLRMVRLLTPAQTQAQFAALAGISVSLIQQLEGLPESGGKGDGARRRRTNQRTLTRDIAERISLATGVRAEWLMGEGESDMPVSRFGGVYDGGWALGLDDILDPHGLALRLSSGTNALHGYLIARLPERVRKEIEAHRTAWTADVRVGPLNFWGKAGVHALARRMAGTPQEDWWAAFVRGRLLPTTRSLLTESPGVVSDDLARDLATDLDRIIHSDRFPVNAGRVGGPDAEVVQPSKPRANLMALCEAFPDCLRMDKGMDAVEIGAALVTGLSEVLDGEPIYQEALFAEIKLRPSTREMLFRRLSDLDRSRLNRLLLEDAFPGELSRDHARGFREWNRITDALRQGGAMRGMPDAIQGHVQGLADSMDLLLRAALKSGTSRTFAVGRVLALRLHQIAKEFGLLWHLEGVARDSNLPKTSVAPFVHAEELRENPEMKWLFYGPPPRVEERASPAD